MIGKPASAADQSDTDTLIRELYDELRTIARREHFRAGRPETLQTTALVSEVYLRLKRRRDWQGQAHFLGCAATAMRHVLIDAARARLAAKRSAPDAAEAEGEQDRQLIRLEAALVQLATVDPELARLVECRFFAGYDERETGEIMGMSERTVRRKWVRARAWIHAEMADS